MTSKSFVQQSVIIENTPGNAGRFVARIHKNDSSAFTLSEMPNHFLKVIPVPRHLRGARYNFNDTNFTITNNAGTTVFTADVNGNLDITGRITADSGSVAGFSLIPDYTTQLAGVTGMALTAGSGTNRVGMSPGVTSGGFVYSTLS